MAQRDYYEILTTRGDFAIIKLQHLALVETLGEVFSSSDLTVASIFTKVIDIAPRVGSSLSGAFYTEMDGC